MKARVVYFICNVLFQLAALFCLLYANTYLNDMLVPESVMWKDNGRRMDKAGLVEYASIKTSALIIQAAIFVLLIYFINRIVLGWAKNDRIIWRTTRINILISLCFIGLLVWGSFKGYLW